MNYLSHARDVTGEPWRVMGVCLPDLLRVVHRRARLDPERLVEGALQEGARLHIEEDKWFHTSDAFRQTNHDIAVKIRARHPRMRASFYGHILLEMLLDAALLEARPELDAHFYRDLEALDPDEVAARAAPLMRAPEHARGLPEVLRFFVRARFLSGYGTDEGVLQKLRGLRSRVAKSGAGLSPLPDSLLPVIGAARDLVRERRDALLTPS